MVETWIQWTCDGCGETEYHGESNARKTEVRQHLKDHGWRSFGPLDYCPKCIKKGNAARRETDMNH